MFIKMISDFFSLKPLNPRETRFIYIYLVVSLFFRLVLAAYFPMTNDEAYYWDWGKDLKLSYFDHPPGVSYLTALSRILSHLLGLDSLFPFFEARLMSPFVFFLSSVFILKSGLLLFEQMHQSSKTKFEQLTMSPFVAAQNLTLSLLLVPGISFLGSLALPDAGLSLGGAMILFACFHLVSKQKLGFQQGLVFGGLLGIAGLFKYHALLIGGGLSLGLMLGRWKCAPRHLSISPLKEWAFWLTTIAMGAICCLPVWIWNYEQGGVSILFQLNHGFGGPRLSGLTVIRFLIAQVILLGPIYFFLMGKQIIICLNALKLEAKQQTKTRDQISIMIVMCGTLPLMATLILASFFKEMMPHWLLPSWVLLVPLVVMLRYKLSQVKQAFWFLLILLPCCILIVRPLRERMLLSLNQDPGPLSELTVWEPLARTVQEALLNNPPKSLDVRCDQGELIAAVRWYSVAQLRFHLQGQPRVLSLDPNHNSYYHDRDRGLVLSGCPVSIVALESSLDREKISKLVQIDEVLPLTVPYHEKQPWVLMRGRLKGM